MKRYRVWYEVTKIGFTTVQAANEHEAREAALDSTPVFFTSTLENVTSVELEDGE